MAFYVYILKSIKDNSFYIGQTRNLEERLQRHNSGRSRFTSGKRPWKIVYSEECATREFAQKRENEIKAEKSKEYIERLINKSR
ncbi:MAG TPA: GIY-YIG nuclease family protein [Planctomycetota bacterium]|nr:GIY-YIG nuclease family protein [Planctomycetota bacterium]